MSVDLDAVRDRWGALCAGFIDLDKVPVETLREKLTLLVADLDALVREVEALRRLSPKAVAEIPPAAVGGHECDLGDECPTDRSKP